MDVLTYAKLKNRVATLEGRVDNIPSPFSYKGSVTSVSDLPALATKGDMYTVTADGSYRVYDGTNWVKLGASDTVFIATYGSTTYAEIASAVNAGKLVFVIAEGIVLGMSGTDASNGVSFLTIFEDGGVKSFIEAVCSSASVWSSTTEQLAITNAQIDALFN